MLGSAFGDITGKMQVGLSATKPNKAWSRLNRTYKAKVAQDRTNSNFQKANIECRRKAFYRFLLIKRTERSDSTLRNSAVRCLIKAIEVASLIIKKPCHFGVVSHERRYSLCSYTWISRCGYGILIPSASNCFFTFSVVSK